MSRRKIDPAVVRQLWRCGNDTVAFASFFGGAKREAEIYNLIWTMRERRRQAGERLARIVARNSIRREVMGIAGVPCGNVTLSRVSLQEVA